MGSEMCIRDRLRAFAPSTVSGRYENKDEEPDKVRTLNINEHVPGMIYRMSYSASFVDGEKCAMCRNPPHLARRIDSRRT